MSPSANGYFKIEDDLVALFERLHADLPADTASLTIRRAEARGTQVMICPRNPRAASVWAHAENGLPVIDFGFGEYEPTWELAFEGENPNSSKEELYVQVEKLCRAVMAGHCENRRRFLTVVSLVRVGTRDYKVSHSPILRPKPPFRGTRTYEAYIPETIDAI